MASAVITTNKNALSQQIKVQGAVIMAHEAIQESYPNVGGNPVPTSDLESYAEVQAKLDLKEKQEAAVFAEGAHFLGVLATDFVVCIGAAQTQELQQFVTDNFLGNVERVTPNMSEMDRREFALHLIEVAEGRVKTDTAALYKAQNQALRDNHAAIKNIAMGESVEMLQKLAPYLQMPAEIVIDSTEFSDELVLPTTDEMEASIQNLTDEAMSPARGITLGFIKKTGRGLLHAVHVTKELILPPLDQPTPTAVMPAIDQNLELQR